ncbi:hypothetical protein Goe16_01990 [Bacillus phage vB_BsuM-Goe16]|nr:hypothetical protein Goe16_00050 [Bacillus phage vB_BsuM-Goe16]WCS68613.1 hypothetical protein Goe16_01990 [Bacillus phage vB_BsuM-Goe16]
MGHLTFKQVAEKLANSPTETTHQGGNHKLCIRGNTRIYTFYDKVVCMEDRTTQTYLIPTGPDPFRTVKRLRGVYDEYFGVRGYHKASTWKELELA